MNVAQQSAAASEAAEFSEHEAGWAEVFAEAAQCEKCDWCVHPKGHGGRHESKTISVNIPARLVRPDDVTTKAGWHSGYEQGAEAMRAACREAVQEELERLGYGDPRDRMNRRLKAAIEGAAP